MLIGLETRPFAAIPSEFSGRARIAGCPWCAGVLMLVLDESGVATAPLDVLDYDLDETSTPGFWNLKGGLIVATAHRCPASAVAFAGPPTHPHGGSAS